MKRVTRNGVIAVAASGAMAMTVPVSAAFAADGGATADGAAVGSPGLISGNTIQLPVHIPVNVCGNTVSVVGLLNPAVGNRCANASAGRDRTPSGGGAEAQAGGKDSPGVISGNSIQLPVHVPANVSGNTVNVAGVGNPSAGNTSMNGDRPDNPAPQPVTPPARSTPPKPLPQPVTTPPTQASLAHTGTDQTLPAVAASAALLLGGAVLYRRHRPRTLR
ncbi:MULTISPECIES: chaplin [unclassified Streptomyces]|uniref:chaplin n=1 Tax=unclassified Streptomyces TaxID=2593676 RepID=UPI00274236BB|nr:MULTISPECIES: chaplin [unclassified Streptomyces]